MEGAELERRLRSVYERGRWRDAALGSLPFLGVVIAAAVLGGRPLSALAIGGLLYVAGVVCLWRGRQMGAAVLPGAIAGGVPLALALGAGAMSHGCHGSACVSWCVPACTVGGVVAGVLVASAGAQRRAGLEYWTTASGFALMVGALGCSCVGFGGILGLASGLLFALVGARLVGTLASKA